MTRTLIELDGEVYEVTEVDNLSELESLYRILWGDPHDATGENVPFAGEGDARVPEAGEWVN